MFPGAGDARSGDAGIGDVQNDTTDSWEAGFGHADTYAITASRGGVSHVENRVPKFLK